MSTPLSLSAVVGAFRAAIAEVALAAQVASPGQEWLIELLRSSRSGRSGPRGVLADDIHYRIHGAGARFRLPNGRIVDVDVDPTSGGSMFDRWRFIQFARSLGLSPADEEVERVLADAVDSGDLRVVRPGWYASDASDRDGPESR